MARQRRAGLDRELVGGPAHPGRQDAPFLEFQGDGPQRLDSRAREVARGSQALALLAVIAGAERTVGQQRSSSSSEALAAQPLGGPAG